jgi:hypothetical protein
MYLLHNFVIDAMMAFDGGSAGIVEADWSRTQD